MVQAKCLPTHPVWLLWSGLTLASPKGSTLRCSELRSSLKEPEGASMDDNPTAVKLDQGGNQAPQGQGRRAPPKALGYITGDMKEFANWLKGIYATLEK